VDEIVKNAGGDLRDRHIYMCGPFGMVQAFADKFKKLGVAAEHIHYEEFNFR
jgi:ferredoxin-NADP reductase